MPSLSDFLSAPQPTAAADSTPTAPTPSLSDFLGTPTAPKTFAPEEVALAPNSAPADQEQAFKSMGINVDLAKKSKNYDPDYFNNAVTKATTPSVAEGGLAQQSGQIPASTPEPGFGENLTQGVAQFGRDVKGLYTKVTGSPADIENQKLQSAIQRNVAERFTNQGQNINDEGTYVEPTGQKVGYAGAGAVAGTGAAALTAAALPEVTATGGIGAFLNVGRAATLGGVGGAAATPTNPGQGAVTGAVTGGVLNVAGQGVGAGVRAISKNTPQQMADIAATSDTLVGPNSSGIKGAGTAEVLGRPNLTGEQSVAQGKLNLPSWLPGAGVVNKFGGWLSGAGASQGGKAIGAESAAFGSTSLGAPKPGAWLDTLAEEPTLQTQQAKIDMHDPSKFGQYYPNLSPQGKNAAITGMLNNAYADAVQRGSNGLIDLPTFNQHLKDLISTTGDQTFIRGEQKWTLQGLQKLTDMAINPSLSKDQLASAVSRIGSSGAGAAALGLIDDIAGPVMKGGHSVLGAATGAAKIPLMYNLVNRVLDNRQVRNGLISLAQGKTPTQQINALASISASLNHQPQP